MNGVTDYRIYTFSKKEIVIHLFIGFLGIAVIAYYFYRSIIAFMLLMPLVILYFKFQKKRMMEKRLAELKQQFKDMLSSISASLNTGYSLENAIREALKEIILLYGEEACITKEMKNMVHQISLNIPVEKVFEEFSNRSGLEDAELFSSIMFIARKGGGDLIEIIKSATINIREKTELLREIESSIRSKKFEQLIMNVIPVFIIAYVDFASPDLIGVMYGNIKGVFIMSGCLLMYGLAFLLSIKITRIEV